MHEPADRPGASVPARMPGEQTGRVFPGMSA